VGELGNGLVAVAEVGEVVELRRVGLDVASGERILVGVDSEAILGGDDRGGVALVLGVEGALLTVSLNALIYKKGK
jgi:hypothetical protein